MSGSSGYRSSQAEDSDEDIDDTAHEIVKEIIDEVLEHILIYKVEILGYKMTYGLKLGEQESSDSVISQSSVDIPDLESIVDSTKAEENPKERVTRRRKLTFLGQDGQVLAISSKDILDDDDSECIKKLSTYDTESSDKEMQNKNSRKEVMGQYGDRRKNVKYVRKPNISKNFGNAPRKREKHIFEPPQSYRIMKTGPENLSDSKCFLFVDNSGQVLASSRRTVDYQENALRKNTMHGSTNSNFEEIYRTDGFSAWQKLKEISAQINTG